MSPNLLQRVNYSPKRLADYRSITPGVVDKIRQLAKSLQGLKMVHLNATPLGGGVAEMLRCSVPLQRDIGLDSTWYVIPPKKSFFEVTKEIHNFMQGKAGDLTEKQKKIYLDYNQQIAGLLAKIKADVFLVHDPQPAAALSFLKTQKPKLSIWRCHIDTSHPNKSVWNFLMPYLKSYDHFVFTMPDYIHQDFPLEKVSFITPVIDPLSEKNKLMAKTKAKQCLRKFGIDIRKPLITQVSRYDPWKDPRGVIDAYRLAKKKIPRLQLALVAQKANDDPEGEKVYQEIKDYAQNGEDIFLLVNLPNNDRAVNAFQAASDIVLQKSTREGFGLTVTEAMWKKAAVIGGNVGGIKLQIEDGVNGFLVNSFQEAAERIIYLFKNPQIKKKISRAAHDSVKSRFLMPHNLLNYLNLLKPHFE